MSAAESNQAQGASGQHTQGPWAVRAKDDSTFCVHVQHHLMWSVTPCVYKEADARLIAAAPDLLRTLELILASLKFEQHMYGSADPRRSTIDFTQAIKMAERALAAATGAPK